MKPIDNSSTTSARITRKVTYRPLPDHGIKNMGQWITKHKFETFYDASSVHDQAEILQNDLLHNLNKFLPEKTFKISSEDQPWITPEIKELDRKKKGEYYKHRRSDK